MYDFAYEWTVDLMYREAEAEGKPGWMSWEFWQTVKWWKGL